MARPSFAVGAAIIAAAVTANTQASAEERAVDRASVVAEALHAHPSIRAAEQRASATQRGGEAEGSLPPPEAMMQIWQVPVAKPWAVGDAQMIMFGVGQSFPAAGVRGARERAVLHEADAERAMIAETARQIRRDVEHAFADYVEATTRHRIHADHRALAARTLDLARARHAGGGSLSDVTQADVELARTDADLATDGTRIDSAARRINALLGRDPLAPLGPPVIGVAETSAWDASIALAKARSSRPDLRALSARRDAQRERTHAAEREASLPSFSVAALYFAPTTPMPQHGYGVNASMTLPWLWGQASARRDASRDAAAASESDVEGSRRPIAGEVASQEANVRAATLRLKTLRDRALPASRRSFDVAWAGYEAARTDLLTLLSTRRAALDIEMEIVMARAALDHALADLDAAVGATVPRRPIDGDSHD
jgi:outer membrane protein, heavy metal efflux system